MSAWFMDHANQNVIINRLLAVGSKHVDQEQDFGYIKNNSILEKENISIGT